MNKKQQYFGLVTFPVIAISIFVLFFLIAAFYFPGSEFSHLNYQANRYSLSHNFLSALGRIESSNGQTNLISCVLFNSSLILIGITIVKFYKGFKELFFTIKDSPRSIILSNYTKPVGVISGLLFAGVGLVPHDFNYYLHIFFAHGAFLMLWITSLIHLLVIYNSNKIAKRFSMGYVVFCVLLFFYLLLIFFGPRVGPGIMYEENELILQVVSQKLIVLAFIFSILIQVWGLSKLLNKSIG